MISSSSAFGCSMLVLVNVLIILNIKTNLEKYSKLANRISESLKQAGINAIGVAARQPGRIYNKQ
ncbi:hypothetical protein AB3538_18380 [Acinetobacter baumannii]